MQKRSVIHFQSMGKVWIGPRADDACRRALVALARGEPDVCDLVVDADDPHREFALKAARSAGLTARLSAGADSSHAAGRLLLFEGATPASPAPAASEESRAFSLRASDGQRWEATRSGEWEMPGWLDETLAAAGAQLDQPVDAIFHRTDELAQTTAPDTRRSGKTLVMIEAICVVLPVVWLLRTPLGLPPMLAALAGLASPLMIVAFCWWLRWRSMGRLWSRARLIAEACRSFMATRRTPVQPVVDILPVVPSLHPLLTKFAAESPTPSPDWRETYLRERIDEQRAYYTRQRDRAMRERKSLTRWSTLLMDFALAVGVGGVIVTLHPRSASWLSLLGGSWLDFALGLAGLALPLGLLVAQSLRLVGESTRRTSRYTQQIVQLDSLRTRFESAEGETALRLVRDAEDALLSEVLDWYFQAETTEDFYTIREQPAVGVAVAAQATPKRSLQLWKGLRYLGAASGFLVRVVLGRLIWVVLTAAVVLMYISLKQPQTPEAASRLSELGRMLDPVEGTLFVPQSVAARNGTIVLAHGMRDGWTPPARDGSAHWSAEMAKSIDRRLRANAPQILLLDWNEGAKASSRHGLNTQDPLSRFLADTAGVKTNGQVTGDFFGIRLVRLVENGQIRRDRPLHLIGHSAGGFVVARAAHVLVAMGFPSKLLHVTILDTPEPDEEIAQRVATLSSAEFYRTSGLVQIDPRALHPALHFRDIQPPAFPDAGTFGANVKAHSYAWQWYRDSITSAKAGDEGFGRSPFCP